MVDHCVYKASGNWSHGVDYSEINTGHPVFYSLIENNVDVN